MTPIMSPKGLRRSWQIYCEDKMKIELIPFDVDVIVAKSVTIQLDASSKEEAENKARQKAHNGEIPEHLFEHHVNSYAYQKKKQ